MHPDDLTTLREITEKLQIMHDFVTNLNNKFSEIVDQNSLNLILSTGADLDLLENVLLKVSSCNYLKLILMINY